MMADLIVRNADRLSRSRNALLERQIAKLERSCKQARVEKMIGEDEYFWLLSHIKEFIRSLKAYARTCQADGLKRRHHQCNRLLRSFSARLASIAKVVILDGRYENIARHDLNCNLLTRLAEEMNLFRPLSGHARLVGQLKANGTVRETLDFSGNIRAAGFLVECVLAAQNISDDRDFASNQQGVRNATTQIRDAILDGYDFWLSFDLAHNFPSVKRQHLSWLCLPEKVISNVLFPNEYICIQSKKHMGIKSAVRQGLPQGAAVSGQIASALIRRKLETCLSGDYRRVSYVDDVVIGARSQDRILEFAKAIKGSFEDDPAGPLTFSRFEVTDSSTRLEFCGHQLSLTDFGGARSVWCRPSNKAYSRFRSRLRERFTQTMNFDQRTDIAQRYAEQWAKSFGSWWQAPQAYQYLITIAEIEAADFPCLKVS